MKLPSVTPLIAAFQALHSSENAERHGKLEDAAKHATEAIERIQEWREGIWSCIPDKCTHGVVKTVDCTACFTLGLAAMAEKALDNERG